MPSGPAITSYSIDSGVVGDGVTNDPALTLNGTAPANSTFNIYDGATLLGSVTASAAGTWTYLTPTLANGAHSFTAGAINTTASLTVAAGTAAALAVTIDTTAPVAPTIASFSTDSGVVGDHITNDNTLTLTGAAEANATVKVYDGATLLGSVAANASGAWSYTTAALLDGAHNFTTTATDVAGNTGAASSALAVTIDTLAPNAPAIASEAVINSNQISLSGSGEANTAIKVYDGTTLLGSTTADASGAWAYTTAALSNGVHSLTATDTDIAGNISLASAAVAQTIGAATVIEANGATTLSTLANHYYLNSLSLKYHGADVTAGQFSGWTPIAAEKTATGYEIAWKSGTGTYTVWTTDNNGNYISNAFGAVSGSDSKLIALEPSFQQDLNGDGKIGTPPIAPTSPVSAVVIEANGATTLSTLSNHYYLNSLSLKYQGADVTAGQFSGWTPIAAEKTATGYEIAWKSGTGTYTVWTTDNNGNYISNAFGAVSGSNSKLIALEPSFQQDLNGDGRIGNVAAQLSVSNAQGVANTFNFSGALSNAVSASLPAVGHDQTNTYVQVADTLAHTSATDVDPGGVSIIAPHIGVTDPTHVGFHL